jgi:hypothetical protein
MKLKDHAAFVDNQKAYFTAATSSNPTYSIEDPDNPGTYITVPAYIDTKNYTVLDAMSANAVTYYNSLAGSAYKQGCLLVMALATMMYSGKTDSGPQHTGDVPSIDSSHMFRNCFYWFVSDIPDDFMIMTTSGGSAGNLESGGTCTYNQNRTVTNTANGLSYKNGIITTFIPNQNKILIEDMATQTSGINSIEQALYKMYGYPVYITQPITAYTPVKEVVKWNPKFEVVAVTADLGIVIEGITGSVPPETIPPLPFT